MWNRCCARPCAVKRKCVFVEFVDNVFLMISKEMKLKHKLKEEKRKNHSIYHLKRGKDGKGGVYNKDYFFRVTVKTIKEETIV